MASEHTVHAASLLRWNSPAARVAYHRSTTTPPAPLPPNIRGLIRAMVLQTAAIDWVRMLSPFIAGDSAYDGDDEDAGWE